MGDQLDLLLLSFIHPGNSYKLPGRSISIRVDREQFNEFPVFYRAKFTVGTRKKVPLVEFKISTNESVYYYHPSRGTIARGEIIYSNSNPQRPLVYGITSNGITSYFKQSSVKKRGDLNVLGDRPIRDLADALINENDRTNGTVTFRVDKKKPYNNISHVRQTVIGGFYKEYTHIPKTKEYNTRNPLVINKVDGTNLKIDFTGDSDIKINEGQLDSISVYFFEYGSQNDIPLMIKVIVDSEEHFYKPTTGHDSTWVKVNPKDINWGKDNKVITEYLDKIKTMLFETVFVLIHKQEPYKMLTLDDSKHSKRDNREPDSKGDTDKIMPDQSDDPIKDKTKKTKGKRKRKKTAPRTPSDLKTKNTIGVKIMKCSPELGDYVCFQHDLTVHKDATQKGFEEHETGHGQPKNITVFISNVYINIDLKIRGGLLGYVGFDIDEVEENTKFMFLQNKTELNVFFYRFRENIEERIDRDKSANSGKETNPIQGLDNKSKPDTIPLMFNYNNHWFKTTSIDKYFVEWGNVDDLVSANPLKSHDASKIKTHLDQVNKMLNRINLNFKVCAKDGATVTTGHNNVPSVTAYAITGPGIAGALSGKPSPDQGGKGNPVKPSTTLTPVSYSGSKSIVGKQVSNTTTISSGQYGIPAPYNLNSSYDITRIYVTCAPFQEDIMFISYTHKTKNGFYIGPSCYRTKEKKARAGAVSARVGLHSLNQEQSHDIQSNDNIYCTIQNDRCIKDLVKDLDGSVDVPAKSVCVYFFKGDEDNNYPLLAEYKGGDNKYQYYVLKHGKDETT